LTGSATTPTAIGRWQFVRCEAACHREICRGGIEIVLVVTIVNNVNNDQVGTVVKFAMENPRKSRL